MHNEFVKIADFGFSKISKDANEAKEGDGIYTANYGSPQVKRGEDYSSKTDIYSLGVMFYELLFGYIPFASKGGKF